MPDGEKIAQSLGNGKRPYKKPEITSETYMERAALGCAKVKAPLELDDDLCELQFGGKSGG